MRKITLLTIALSMVVTKVDLIAQVPFNTPDNIGSGNCLNFDGAGDLVNCGSSSSIDNIFSGGGTVEAWISPNSDGENNTGVVVSKILGQGNGWQFGVKDQTGSSMRLYFIHEATGTDDRNYHTTNRVVDINEWAHVAVVYNKDNFSNLPVLFLNGEVVAGIEYAVEPSTAMGDDNVSKLYISNREADGIKAFDGQIDEVRAWNVARSQTEIRNGMCKTLPNNETGLVGYWNMNEGTGNTVSDLTSNANHGIRQ